MNCDVVTVLNGFKVLEGVGFKRPDVPKDPMELAENWRRLLADLSPDYVAAAFDRYAKSGESTYWPKVGRIRALAIEIRKERPIQDAADLRCRYLQWENQGWRDEAGNMSACPVCDVPPQSVTPEPSQMAKHAPATLIRVPHDLQRHREAHVRALA